MVLWDRVSIVLEVLELTMQTSLASKSQICLLLCLPSECWEQRYALPWPVVVVIIIILRLDFELAQVGFRFDVWLRISLNFDLSASTSPVLALQPRLPCLAGDGTQGSCNTGKQHLKCVPSSFCLFWGRISNSQASLGCLPASKVFWFESVKRKWISIEMVAGIEFSACVFSLSSLVPLGKPVEPRRFWEGLPWNVVCINI